jgi:hypothetical protein
MARMGIMRLPQIEISGEEARVSRVELRVDNLAQ